MRATVLNDPALAKHAGRFVWLSIDTEKTQNAPFAKKYPIRASPSLYVIDPQKEAIALRWVGGANVSQLEKLFAQGERAVRGGARGAAEALAKADALYGEGKYAEAAPAYREAIRFQPVSGAPVMITLKRSGARVRIPARASYDLTGQPIEGNGVTPDEVINPTRADITARRDVALERAVAFVCPKGGC